MSSENVVGIDVCKEWLDVHVHGETQSQRVCNDGRGFRTLIRQMQVIQPGLIVFEATGGYEREAAKALGLAGFAVAVVNPTRVRRFAQSMGIQAKTDEIDAKVIAHFADVSKAQLYPNTPRTALEERLAGCTERRAQLQAMSSAEQNRLSTCPECVRERIKAHLEWIAAEVDSLDAEIDACIAQRPDWQERAAIIDSVPGIGRVTAITLIAELPELGHVNRRAAAALVGVAPFNKDSGRKQRKRKIFGGRSAIRRVLYMAAMSASQCNSVIRPYYQSLLARGKERRVALVACMRKLVVMVNAMVRDGQVWRGAPA